ncbi:Glutamate--tRNA ligase 2 [Limihaloglobus sulfuriphilus]|uniref:Glutamate--tRNA ligase n=1 Tax=Limihaloglobus sulfuriphilus TaxID=1851148 RepID=A0A1Q2MJ28_9BACT|nr:glutamate--tRNA ligase [Limihaloglobus sulfuriphilus]AQQ72387.1 Glutamate--tRNA ligase 2 [Limihaloglobus sulfuriphilus]
MAVTRFAPSPTGYLHIGGARTALFSWLLARKSGGKFILRIEDTDQKRNTATAMGQVIKDLRWLGIEWDEGPEIGGPNGPYLQSQRLDIYNKYIRRLLDEKKAYYCFDTSQDLVQMREAAEAKKESFSYPRPEVFPTDSDAQNAREQGKPVTVRFCVERDKPVVVDDRIRGKVTFAPEELSDFIIQKADGYPTFHLAVVVDDALMGVTHILRGQEHLMNTPGHQLLQRALGFEVPQYAHMSITVSDNGGKLSKRERPNTLRQFIKQMPEPNLDEIAAAGGIELEELERFLAKKSVPDDTVVDKIAAHVGAELPEINVVDFERSGYIPEAMVNFVSLLGWNPGTEKEIMTVDELVSLFDLSRLSKANSFFDRKKLLAFNTEHINTVDAAKLTGYFKRYLELNNSPILPKADDELLKRLVELNRGARTLAEIESKCMAIFIDDDKLEYDPKAVKKVLHKSDPSGIEMLPVIREKLAGLDVFSNTAVESALRGITDEKGVGLGKVAQPLRVAICGGTISPTIFDTVSIIGKESVLKRIDTAIEKFSKELQ